MRLCILLAILGYATAYRTFEISCGDTDGIGIQMTTSDFTDAYTQTFHMSDGSKIVDSADSGDMEHMNAAFERMKVMMSAIGAVQDNNQSVAVEHTVRICGQNMTRILMLAVLGNFVSSPADPKYNSQSSAETLATVVVDYSGSLVVVHSFATMRTYFLESLLFISIIAMARLSLVKKVQYIAKK
jgi:hypothetical protein